MLINIIAMVHSVLLHDFSSFFDRFGFFEFSHEIAVFALERLVAESFFEFFVHFVEHLLNSLANFFIGRGLEL